MTEGVAAASSAEANLAAANADLAAARAAGDVTEETLLEALIGSGGRLILYRPERQHYGVLFGDLEHARHVAVMVPGVGGVTNMCKEWLPSARNLFTAAPSTAVVLWKGYDNPTDILDAAVESVEVFDLTAAGSDLAEFVRSLAIRPDQTLTIVAHSFGSIVTGAALADAHLACTDVVVAGSPGMTVDGLRQLHLKPSHFFSEEAPGDALAEAAAFGTAPTEPMFGGTRMRTNAPGHVEVKAHSSYFLPGSQSLENIVDVVTGRYSDVADQRPSVADITGGIVALAIRLPTLPVRVAGRHYRGPGFRLLVNAVRIIDVTATESGNLVREIVDLGERTLEWAAHRLVRHEDTPQR